MLEVLHRTPADARALPWKNGRGTTRELALWPEHASLERADFDWRLSLAGVAEPGPFSSFPGFERILVVTRGAGLLLRHGDAAPRARLRPLEPYRFDGAWSTTAELVGGAVDDLNLIFRPDAVAAGVEALRLGERVARETLRAGQGFVQVLAGRVLARVTGEEEPLELATGHGLWLRGLVGGEELVLEGHTPDTEVVRVELGQI